MNLSTKQVADKLGITCGTVRTLRNEGRLKDTAEKKEGKTKHFSFFNSKEVNEFAKTYQNRKRRNSISSKIEIGQPVKEIPSIGILSRLEKIENKLDRLLKVWG